MAYITLKHSFEPILLSNPCFYQSKINKHKKMQLQVKNT